MKHTWTDEFVRKVSRLHNQWKPEQEFIVIAHTTTGVSSVAVTMELCYD